MFSQKIIVSEIKQDGVEVCWDMKELHSDLSTVNSLYDTIHASLKSWQIFKTFVSGVKA